MVKRLKIVFSLVFLIVGLMVLIPSSYSRSGDAVENSTQPTKWTYSLPAKVCLGSTHTQCHRSSPVLADINGDGRKDIIVATNNGHVLALRDNGSSGSLLWDVDIAPFFGMAAGTHEISSSPAVADIDEDGYPEIAIGAGTTSQAVCTQGGLLVLNHNGQVESGWPYVTVDEDVPPAGCADSIFASPALGDLDNDGDLEIVAGGFDKRIYAWHHNGSLVSGFPADSYHLQRFPTWTVFQGQLADTIWSSPALADLDGDGYLDIVIGTDEGNYDDRYGGDSGGWTCPYELPPGWSPGYCGGSVYALDRFGDLLPGFPKYILEAIQSTPAVTDANSDGLLDIFIGTGTFYYNNSPDHPTDGFRVYGWDANGNDLPGWAGGKVVGAGVPASPAVGDIAGDDSPEIIALGMDRMLYAWHDNGVPVGGFPMRPLNQYGNDTDYSVGLSVVLANYDSDDKMEIFINQSWVVTIIDGNGAELTSTDFPDDPRPMYIADGLMLNNPAIGDIDGDGSLEMVVHNSRISVWNLTSDAGEADWSAFKYNAARTGFVPQPPRLPAPPENFFLLHQTGQPGPAEGTLVIKNDGGGAFDWEVTAPNGATATPASGSTTQSTPVTVSIPLSGRSDGWYYLGDLEIEATVDGQPIEGSPWVSPLQLYIGQVYQVYLPVIP